MFRFIHSADIHLDSPLEGLAAYDGAPLDALRGATRLAFENLVQTALDETVDFVLIAGDVYDGDWKDFSTGLFFARQMARLNAVGIPVYLIAGNHDAASVLTRRLNLPDNVQVFSTRTVETREVPHLPVVIHGRGFPHRAVPENLVPEYPPPLAAVFNIGLLHTSLTGASGHDTYAPCSLGDLTHKGYDYWALGHVHRPQVLSRDPWVVFPGNLQGRHIRESGPRGCQLVSVDDSLQVVAAEHRPLDVVRWDRVAVDIQGMNDEREVYAGIDTGLQAALSRAGGRLLAVRITLAGATPLHEHLKHELPRLRAQSIVQAQLAGADNVWIEEVEVATSAVFDPAELAARDVLTGVVLETLAAAETGPLELPAEVEDLLRILPVEIRDRVKADLAEENRSALLDDVRAIVLDALTLAGGTP
jgi:DNA repair exonuclease SbcCD nuclease subunit